MAQLTKIEWTSMVWNFLRGCRRISEGCGSDRGGGCYAERQAIRHAGPGGAYEGLVKSTPKGPRWTGEISFHEDILLEPLKRKKPTTYFVNSMSDLFYEKVTDEMLDKAFAVMALTPQHTYQILTKRPERMMRYFGGIHDVLLERWWDATPLGSRLTDAFDELPLPNVWLGVSVEDQKTADERIPLLLDAPAALRWISAEPLLGPIDLNATPPRAGSVPVNGATFDDIRGCLPKWQVTPVRAKLCNGLDWVVVGGESGPNARSCDLAWIYSIVKQCKAATVPVFVKQLGAIPYDSFVLAGTTDQRLYLKNKKGGDIDEFPFGLRVREFPTIDKRLPAHAL